jgi:HEPN domain-containing protein
LTPEESEEAVRLLSAARADLRAAKVLAADADQADEVIGFHAQQAVEKALKSVLAASGVEIPYTHDLAFLLDLAAEQGVSTPKPVARADWLTPWAVAARYGASVGSLDREAAVTVADDGIDWATNVLGRQSD